MKKSHILPVTGRYRLALILILDLFFIFVSWLLRPESFASIGLLILLFSALVLATGFGAECFRQKKVSDSLQAFLNHPDEDSERLLLEAADSYWHPAIRSLSGQLREQREAIMEKQMELNDYQEFIEGWTHEIKTPLSLATLVLDNHEDEMSCYVRRRMEHVRRAIESDVDRILYYARLQAEHMDYRFERIALDGFVAECLKDFQAIAEERHVKIRTELPALAVICDRKVLRFMLCQLLSNAFKYTAEKGTVLICCWTDNGAEQKSHLAIRDNGEGVPPEDEPFLFDKGFTGNHPGRQNATGMGLYLVKKYAEALALEVTVEPISVTGKGFGIELAFPVVL